MVKQIIRSKALYGRIDLEIHLQALKPHESRLLLKKRNPHEALLYLMIFGGVPKYLEQIDQSKSFAQNMNVLCFQKNGFFVDELNKIFYSQFSKAGLYSKIIYALSKNNLYFSEIAKKLNTSAGGGLKEYIRNLERSDFVRTYLPVGSTSQKEKKYKLFDEFLIFYLKFIYPQLKQIQQNEKQKLFELNVEPSWKPWLGISFETFCLKNAMKISSVVWFFRGYCEHFQPQYCSLMDCGTIPMDDAIWESFLTFEGDEDVGGVCGYILPDAPVTMDKKDLAVMAQMDCLSRGIYKLFDLN